ARLDLNGQPCVKGVRPEDNEVAVGPNRGDRAIVQEGQLRAAVREVAVTAAAVIATHIHTPAAPTNRHERIELYHNRRVAVNGLIEEVGHMMIVDRVRAMDAKGISGAVGVERRRRDNSEDSKVGTLANAIRDVVRRELPAAGRVIVVWVRANRKAVEILIKDD